MADDVAQQETTWPETVGYPGLPVQTLDEALKHFRRPFTPQAMRWKVQNVFSGASGCIVVGYIDARLVIERLNTVVGKAWTAAPRRIEGEQKLMWADLTVLGVTRSDLGGSEKGMSKDLWSDAVKRAAVQFGIGVPVYALPEILLFRSDSEIAGWLEPYKNSKGKDMLRLKPAGFAGLNDRYKAWLENGGERLFGRRLDHGDVEMQTQLPADEAGADEFVPAPAPLADTDEARRLYAECETTYAHAAEAGGAAWSAKLPPARFRSMLAGAQHSEEQLQALLDHVQGLTA